ncbi:MAG: ABC transporter permease [Deltaproteobacteria bacterium]|nr:MAG: ABC transporter permease [Deltaproteobacteria bacterium]
MRTVSKNGKYVKLLLYLIVVVLINVAGLTLFFRLDLTANHIYSLSSASKKVVSSLAEPLTINVFFTKDLPAPHNNTERYLHDLLEEYALAANQYFNYRFYNVSAGEGDIDDQTHQNQALAQAYGINPVQIQRVESDEIKFQRAYMGLVLIHGDMVERIDAITSTDGLEYKLTTAIQKLNNKISAMLSLKDKIQATVYLSSSLNSIAPLLQLPDLNKIPEKIESIVAKLNKKNYDKLAYRRLDPDKDPALFDEVEENHLLALKWPAVPDHNIKAGKGAIGLVISHGKKKVSIPLLQVIKLPLIGTQYQVADLDKLEEVVENALEKVININEELGFLADHGTLGVSAPTSPMMPPQSNIAAFRRMASRTYTLRNINLEKEAIPESLNSLIIARPTKKFSDYELYQIDQFLMRGNNLILFPDRFQEVIPGQQQMMMGGRPTYLPIDTGLKKLLSHWGVDIGKSYVMDEHCFKQRVSQQRGGGEQPIYFAPLILNRNISKEFDFIKNIKGMVVLKASPIHIDQGRIDKINIIAHRLIASSDRAWEMKEPINLNPMMMSPPPENEPRSQFALAYLLTGQFPSYFEGKPIPAKIVAEKKAEKKDKTDTGKPVKKKEKEKEAGKPMLTDVSQSGEFIAKGRPAKIFIMAASDMLTDTILDEDGRSPNAVFIMNIIDALNNRNDIAVMRSKTQQLNPLNAPSSASKFFIKMFNIIGLPVLVVLFGLLVWIRRHARKKRIEMAFTKKVM